MTYPVYRANGSLGESAVHSLCGSCVERADQCRQEALDDAFIGPLPIHCQLTPAPEPRRESWQYHSLGLVGVAVLLIALFTVSLAFLYPPPLVPTGTVANAEASIVPSQPTALLEPIPIPAAAASTPQALTPELPQPAVKPARLAGKLPLRLLGKASGTPLAATTAPARLVVRLSTTTPQRSRGFWVTVIATPANKAATARPTIHFRDSRGRSYRLTLEPKGEPGEWTRRFGLESEGTWRGLAVLREGKRTLRVPLPEIQVLP